MHILRNENVSPAAKSAVTNEKPRRCRRGFCFVRPRVGSELIVQPGTHDARLVIDLVRRTIGPAAASRSRNVHFPRAIRQISSARAQAARGAMSMQPAGEIFYPAGSLAAQYHRLQTCPAPHTAHLRTCRLVVRATQTPLTRVLPAPHAAATCVIIPSCS